MTTMESEALPKITNGQNILKRSVCLVLRANYFGNYRKLDTGGIEMEKNGTKLEKEKKVIHANQTLVDSADIKKAVAAIEGAKQYLKSVSFAGDKVFGDGCYIIPLIKMGAVNAELKKRKADVQAESEAVAANWPAILHRAAQARGSLFDPKLYPTADEMTRKFSIDWNYISFAAPDQLLEVDKAAYEEAEQKAQQRLEHVHVEWLAGMREAALKVMRELKTRLTPAADGKPKALQPTAMRDLNEFIANLPALNLTDDNPLVDVMAPVAAVAQGLNVETLRSAPAVRAMLLAKAEEACAQLDDLVTSGRRAMNLSGLGNL